MRLCADCGVVPLPIDAPGQRKFCLDCRRKRKKPGRSSGPRPEERLAPLRLVECAWAECVVVFETRISTQRFCSKECQKRDEKRRHTRERRSWRLHTCSQCGVRYRGAPQKVDGQHVHRYCSKECQAEGKRWRFRTVFSCAIPWADCMKCGARFVSHQGRLDCPACWVPRTRHPANTTWFCGYCAECGDAFVVRHRRPVKFCSRSCKVAVSSRNRLTKKRTNFVERVFRSKVFRRDHWICQLCGDPTSSKWTPNDPWAPTLDHIIPIAAGGEHSYANTQCAHAICNSRKQDSIMVPLQRQLSLL